MYVQKKMMAKLEQERLADLANVHQQQMDALKTFASLQQMNSVQQQQLTAFLTAAMINKEFALNQQSSQPQQLNAPVLTNNKINHSKATNQTSRKRSHSELDTFSSSSEEEPYCYAKLRWVDGSEDFRFVCK